MVIILFLALIAILAFIILVLLKVSGNSDEDDRYEEGCCMHYEKID